MKKYFVSHVDLSEIATVSATAGEKEKILERLSELGVLNTKRKPDMGYIKDMSDSLSRSFFVKLKKRLSRWRNGGIDGIYNTMKNMYAAKEYTAVYLYLSIFYGFLEWQVPPEVTLLPASVEALKAYEGEFMKAFELFMNNVEEAEEAEHIEDLEDEDDEKENDGYM